MDRKQLAREAELFWRERYAAPFMKQDAEAYAAAFALPCLIRAENLERAVFRTHAELLAYVREMLKRAKQTGWARSTIDRFEVEVLEDEVATVLVEASRFDEQGQRLARLYGCYALNRVAGEWKMVSIFGGFS